MTIKPKIVFTLIAFAALALGTIVFAPASLLDAPARAALAPYGDLTNTAGTLWSGSGVLAMGSNVGNSQGAQLASTVKPRALKVPITWQFTPASLVRLRLGFDLVAKSDTIAGVAHAGVGFRNIEINNADINIDANFISAFKT